MIKIENVSKSFISQNLFSQVSYHFPLGERIALVGANGTGKTTLLRIICGETTPDNGQIIRPNGYTVGYLPQAPSENPKPTVLEECLDGDQQLSALKKTMQSIINPDRSTGTGRLQEKDANTYAEAEALFRIKGGYTAESTAKKILTGLGFWPEQWTESPLNLSGGWRMRLEIARLLLSGPEFLVLDEPTNHLDLPSLAWFERYLNTYKGTILFVSHDRALLNRLPTTILHLQGGSLTPYRGQFDTFLELKDVAENQREKELAKIKQRRAELEKFVDRFGAKASKARQAQSRMKMIGQLISLESGLQGTSSEQSIKFTIPAPAKSPRILIEMSACNIGYSQDKPLLSGLELSIERQDRLGVVGANGLGKSTLLKTVAGLLPALGGERRCALETKIGYFSQDQMDLLDQSSTVLENLMRLTSLSEPKARDLLGGFLFSGVSVTKSVQVLSGGEKSRLVLAAVLGSGSNLLILDEPTNHLDMASVEALELALESYEGTIICVSHDREFLERICNQTFVLATGKRFARFLGNLSDYQVKAAEIGFPDIFAESSSDSDDSGRESKTSDSSQAIRRLDQKERRKLEKLISQLENEIALLSLKKQELSRSTEVENIEYSALMAIQSEITELESKLEFLESQCLQAMEKLENLPRQD